MASNEDLSINIKIYKSIREVYTDCSSHDEFITRLLRKRPLFLKKNFCSYFSDYLIAVSKQKSSNESTNRKTLNQIVKKLNSTKNKKESVDNSRIIYIHLNSFTFGPRNFHPCT